MTENKFGDPVVDQIGRLKVHRNVDGCHAEAAIYGGLVWCQCGWTGEAL